MVEFYTKLEKEGGPGGPQFLSDHPNPGNRVELVRQAISKYPRKTYRKNSAQFEQIKAEVAKMHPLTMQQVAQQQGQRQPQGQIGEINSRDVMPSGQFRSMDHSAFQISYPDNWQVFGDANSAVTIAPQAGVAQSAIAYGVIINGLRPQSGQASLAQATRDLLSSLQQSNPGLGVASNSQDIQV